MANTPENADLLQQLMDNIEDNIFFKDSNSKFIMINKANARWFGLTDPKEVVGMDDFDFFEEDFARRQLEEERQIRETGESVVCEEQASTRDGRLGWGSVTKVPLRNKEGRIIGTMGIGRDITELKKKELDLKRANDQIAEDLQLAARLQQAFLPQSYPSFTDDRGRPLIQFHHYYEADVQLGGDFCSIYRLSDSKAGLLICDVMGHGVRAALVTGIIYTIADDLVQKAETPGDFLTALNRRLAPLLQAGEEYLFATAAYFTIDVETGELDGALAGHALPLLIEPKKGASQLQFPDEQLGPALAVVSDYTYPSVRQQLRPGDQLLMYTDGICEAVNASSAEFGVEHLKQTIMEHNDLPLQGLVSRIIEEVQHHVGSNRLGDDICLLGFRLEGIRSEASGRG